MSEREAARMLERLRATEEDEEFERAFRSMVRTAVYLSICLSIYLSIYLSIHIFISPSIYVSSLLSYTIVSLCCRYMRVFRVCVQWVRSKEQRQIAWLSQVSTTPPSLSSLLFSSCNTTVSYCLVGALFSYELF